MPMTESEKPSAVEFALQAHDALHKGNVAVCHEMLHKALGVDNDQKLAVAPIAHIQGFDDSFRTACRKNGISAMYLAIGGADEQGRARIMSGGDAELCAYFDKRLRETQK